MAKQKSLKKKAASGMVWTTIQKFSKTGIQFVSGIILARLLTPFDYGCIGMLAIFMSLSETFIDGGFGSALIQKKKPTQVDYSTIFYWNIVLSIVMYVILFFSAPAISRFYNIPILCDVLRVQGLILIIHALNNIQRNQLRKQLKFKIISVTRITTSIICLTITIIMAYMGYGVWALVAQYLLGSAIPTIVYWIYTKWRPSWTFSLKSFHELFGFGFYMLLTNLINTFSTKMQGLLIGAYYNPSILGYFSKAQGTEATVSSTISGIMTSVTYPLYAEVQDDMLRMHNMIKHLTSTIAYLTFPFMTIMILVAKPAFIFLYSNRWIQCVPYFQILCLTGMGICLSSVNNQSIAAVGKSKVMFTWTIIKRSVSIIIMFFSLFIFGIYGLLWGLVFTTWFAYFVNIGLVSRYVGYKWNKQLSDIIPLLMIVSIIGCLSYYMVGVLDLNMYADGALKLFIFIILYLIWSLFFKPESYTYTMGIIKPMFVKFFEKLKK